uniref:GMC family oxidoreductase n=1 Tax=uncultured Acidovorax sp. TaxID=158751 RepID=UPI0025F3573B|nr:GMC oxidoreductase [uncultured Acidovorax sp.]
MTQKFDYLVLGGGTAGCALAARLSEDTDKQVLLVEAGRDLQPGSLPENIRSRYPGYAYLDKRNLWTELQAVVSGVATRQPSRRPRNYEQARVLGGGSAINAMVANRGSLEDYDEWGQLGANGWSGQEALRYFRKLERDCDFNNEYHGQSGPISVRRLPPERVSPFVKAVCKSLVDSGHPALPDQNGEWKDGVFPAAIAVSDNGERIPTSIAYLTPQVRSRSNLRIVTDTTIERLIFEGKNVVGAEVGGQRLLAGETIVCMGGIHSAALLLRNGIGPEADLRALGIEVRADRPGVGANLMEHPLIAVSTYLPKHARVSDLAEHHDQALLRYTSSIPDAVAGDMHVAIIGRTAWHAIGQRMGTLLVWVNKSWSRGCVKLRSADPADEPLVSFALLSDQRDLTRIKEGFRIAVDALMNKRLDGMRGPVFPTSYSERVRKVSAPGVWNAFQMRLFSHLLDWAGPLRSAIVHRVITLGVRADKLLADDAQLTEFVVNNVSGVWHASGTCRMGASSDPMAVTDGAGRVYGVTGLRVCDSSVMPSIPRANTNMPTLMLAERMADLIKEQSQKTSKQEIGKSTTKRMVDDHAGANFPRHP